MWGEKAIGNRFTPRWFADWDEASERATILKDVYSDEGATFELFKVESYELTDADKMGIAHSYQLVEQSNEAMGYSTRTKPPVV